jgi:autophagy-related protein 17
MSPSPTSPASSNASVEPPEPAYQEPGLDKLVTFFIAAKRSLSATTNVYRANEIVTAARDDLTENAVLSAKNAFLGRAISDQVAAVEAAHKGAELISVETHDDFQVGHARNLGWVGLS